MIDMKKKYRTRSGLPVRILCVDRAGFNPVVYLIMEDGGETIVSATIDGRFASFPGQENGLDLIEIQPFEGFKTDDLVVVWDGDSGLKQFRYFSHTEDGYAVCFVSGTSYYNSGFYVWTNCRKATPEEIKSKIVNQEI
jgi:hypothetical protein